MSIVPGYLNIGNANPGFYGSTTTHTLSFDEGLKEYIEFLFQVVGVDLKYEDFQKMSCEDRKAFLRDIKINKIL